MKRLLYLFGLLQMLATPLFAGDNLAKECPNDQTFVTSQVRFSSSLNTTLHKFDDTNRGFSNSTAISPSFSWKNGVALSTSFAIDKNLEGTRKEAVRDSFLALSSKLGKHKDWMIFSGSLLVYLPISEHSRKTSTLQTGYKIAPKVSVDLSHFGLKNMSSFYRLDLTHNFHRLEVATNGSSNHQFRVTQSLGLGLMLFKKLSLGVDGSYTKSFTYQNNAIDTYSFGQSITFIPIGQLDLTLGHTLGGNVIAVNGRDSNIELFDKNRSTIFFAIGFTYK